MLAKSFSFFFFLKQTRNLESGKRHIYIRITVDGKSVEISTKVTWPINRWNPKSGRTIGNREDAKTVNAYLDTLANKIYESHKSLLEANKPVTAIAVKNYLNGLGIEGEKKMLLEEFQAHNNQMEALVGREYAPLTMKRYKTSLEHTREFIEWKYGAPDMEIQKLDYEFISEYAFWLKTARKCNHNTAMKYLSNVKKIVLLCVRKKWLKKDPFEDFKIKKKEVIRYPLSERELKTISEKKFDIERIEQVRDIFLFSCYTGLSYIDTKQLEPGNIAIGIDGEKWLFTARQKTDSPTAVPLLPKALEIIKKYQDHPYCRVSGKLLPVISNQKMNAYLKEIADLCNIRKVLTFHIARHTFATTVTLENAVPLETVSKLLGHRSIRQTQHYAKVQHMKISNDMQALKERLALPKDGVVKNP